MATDGTLAPQDWAFWDDWMQAHRLLTDQLGRDLQRNFELSKAEFSVLVTLQRVPGSELRVNDLANALAWDKSRVSHLLTRMEARGFVTRAEAGAAGRRTGVGITAEGADIADRAIEAHGSNIRRYFLDGLTPEHAATLREWSAQTIASLGDPETADEPQPGDDPEPAGGPQPGDEPERCSAH